MVNKARELYLAHYQWWIELQVHELVGYSYPSNKASFPPPSSPLCHPYLQIQHHPALKIRPETQKKGSSVEVYCFESKYPLFCLAPPPKDRAYQGPVS